MLKNLTDDSYIKTRISQYESLKKDARELMPINTMMIIAQAPDIVRMRKEECSFVLLEKKLNELLE